MDKVNEARLALCPVCNANRFKDWRWSGLSVCSDCGHVLKIPMTTSGTIEQNQEAFFNADFALQDDTFTQFYERMNSRRRLEEINVFVPDGRVLEVGVGRGNLLFALRNAGYQVDGLDLSAAVCDAVQSRYGVPVHCTTLEEYAEATRTSTYDVVIMCHVLEHMELLSPALNAIRHLLREGGILYIAAPNLYSWNAYLPGWTGYEPYHMHYFCSKTLRQVLESAGFNILYETTFEPLSGWFNSVVRSIRHHSPELTPPIPDQLRMRAKKGILWFLYNITRIGMGCLLSPLRWFQSVAGYGEELVMIAQYRFPK